MREFSNSRSDDFNSQKGGLLLETRQHQSYLELKKDVGEEFARKALLYNLKFLKNNVRATARAMKCSPHTVYLTIRKEIKRNSRDSSHKPKSKHPRYMEEEKEEMTIRYRKKTKLGKRRLRYYIFQKEGSNIPESTIGKVIKRAGLERKKRKRVKRDRTSPFYNMAFLFPFQEMQVDVKEILDKETLPKEVYRHLEASNLPLFQWTVIDVLTRIRFLSFSYRKDWFCGKAYLQLIIWWQKIYNLDRPHQGLGNLTPHEKLKSLGYPTGEEICLFPTLILDSVCCLDPSKIKTKSVQYHLDQNLIVRSFS